MLQLLQRLKPSKEDAKIMEEVARLAAREREVRTLEMLIEHISSLDEEDLARLWPSLVAAIYSTQTPNQPSAQIASQEINTR